jgi:putative FmdB family regulatory protein
MIDAAMPTYEYICEGCRHEFEQFQSITAAPVKTCPECKKKKVKRKISVGAGFIFKGGGFYETDYRSDSYKKAADADKPPSTDAKPESAKPEASKPDASKPEAAKTDAKPADAPAKSTKPAATKPSTAAKSASKKKS